MSTTIQWWWLLVMWASCGLFQICVVTWYTREDDSDLLELLKSPAVLIGSMLVGPLTSVNIVKAYTETLEEMEKESSK